MPTSTGGVGRRHQIESSYVLLAPERDTAFGATHGLDRSSISQVCASEPEVAT